MSQRGRNILFLLNLRSEWGSNPRSPDFPSRQPASTKTANEYIELGLGGSPSKKQRTKSPETEMPEEMMEAAASPAEEILATPLAEEEEILSDGERSDWTTIPTSSEERAKKRREEAKEKRRKGRNIRKEGRKEAEGTTNRRREPAKISLLNEPSHVHQVD